MASLLLSISSPGISAPTTQFRAISADSGVTFRHAHGGGGERFMVETMGAGVVLADLDVDGRLDLYFVQGAPTPGAAAEAGSGNALFRGAPNRGFTPTAAAASSAYGMGAAAADYDDDGFPDLYVSNFGPNELWRSNGDGTFTETAASAGVDDASWGASVAWGDLTGDGLVDLYVTNYVDFGWDNHKYCGDPRRDLRAYCHPDVYNAVADRLFSNTGDGTFIDIGEVAGIADRVDGKGLGVALADYDDDGDLDIYVANDSTRNFLFTNAGDATFVEDGILAGVGFSPDGQAEAGMGTDWGDVDGDGRLDLFVTNLDLETNGLYRNLGGGAFSDERAARGVAEPSLRFVGFGTNWGDIDNDGDLDLFVANGHIIDNITELRDGLEYAQRNHLFVNDNGRLREGGLDAGLERVAVSRGSALGDFDGDGDLDVVVSNNNDTVELLRNDSENAMNSLSLRLVGRSTNRSGVAARVFILGDGGSAVRELSAGNSYCSSGPLSIHVGLGEQSSSLVEVRWPDGTRERLGTLSAGNRYVVQQGRGVVASTGLRPL